MNPEIVSEAAKAERLRQNADFLHFIEKFRERQVTVFLNAGSSPEARETAHYNVRGIAAFMGILNAAVGDLALEKRKDSAP